MENEFTTDVRQGVLTNQIFSHILNKIVDEQVRFYENELTSIPNEDQIVDLVG